jgi:hypothetical protein
VKYSSLSVQKMRKNRGGKGLFTGWQQEDFHSEPGQHAGNRRLSEGIFRGQDQNRICFAKAGG